MSLVNTVLQNRYSILRELASGGMGAVYEGDDMRLGVKIAVKEYRLQGEEQLNTETRDYYRQAFEREARLLATLRHDALPRVIDHFTEGDGQFLVMEFIEGDDLMKALKKRGSPFPVAEVLSWADQLLTVLDYLHKRNLPVIHRDIKPHNLKVDDEGRLILIDFGLARGAVKGMTKVGFSKSIGGYTPHFASIEQILRDDSTWQRTAEVILKPEELQRIMGKETDAGSDLYSVGATLYCLLTNAPPDNAIERLLATVRNQADPLRSVGELNLQVTKSIEAVIQQAMNLDRENRYSSAIEMREILRNANKAESEVLTVVSSTIIAGSESPHTGETTIIKTKEEAEKRKQLEDYLRQRREQDGFVLIPAGEFMMGSENGRDEEKPVHKVRISKSFEMGKYQVTQEQWQAVMGNNPSHFKDGANLPVEFVSWDDVQEFIKRLNAKNDGYHYRLPTEAEWEYACRAGTTGDYAGNGDEMAWYDKNAGGKTHPIGQKKPNHWGVYDMHGNVWEWCADWYDEKYYKQSPEVDPTGPSTGLGRVHRGGSWSLPAAGSRAAFRRAFVPWLCDNELGFRLVRTCI